MQCNGNKKTSAFIVGSLFFGVDAFSKNIASMGRIISGEFFVRAKQECLRRTQKQ
jgi:hypothetical protein